MSKIDYAAIYDRNRNGWRELTNDPQRFENLLAGHYAESNHFIYELLQNAEDAGAHSATIEHHPDRLIFRHDGRPFDANDAAGVSSMLATTKRDDSSTIGHFGIGFKSVFRYTRRPEIYSDGEAFAIENFLLPIEIENTLPSGDHSTKIVIPFDKPEVSGDSIIEKLRSLNGEILLFLRNLQMLNWRIVESGESARIEIDRGENGIITCRHSSGETTTETKFLKYTARFDLDEMKSAEVSVAYKLNPQGRNINAMENVPFYVYFPTREESHLPFIVHGSFETAVSREKLITPSSFNDRLFERLVRLIVESLKDLSKRKLTTQNFMRRILLPAFKSRLPDLKAAVNSIISLEHILLDAGDHRRRVNELLIADPIEIASFKRLLFRNTFPQKHFADISDEHGVNFREYVEWLRNDLHIEVFTLEDWAVNLRAADLNIQSEDDLQLLKKFYAFLQNKYREGRISWQAWDQLRRAPIILTEDQTLVAAYKDGKPNVYRSPTDQKLHGTAIVNRAMEEEFSSLFNREDAFNIPQFDSFQAVKALVERKYVYVNQSDLELHAEDMKQILALFDNHDLSSIRKMLQSANIIKTDSEFVRPREAYIDISDEGIDLRIYFAEIAYRNVDSEFYSAHGISSSDLRKLGVISTPVHDGKRADFDTKPQWQATGEFCPELWLDGLELNLNYIRNHPNDELSRKKSAEILKLLVSIRQKLSGEIRIGKIKPKHEEREAAFLELIRKRAWVFDGSLKPRKTSQLSRLELNAELYREVPPVDDAFRLLNFRAVDKEFPARPIVNYDRLKKYIAKQFVEAKEVHYEKITLSVRTSRSPIEAQTHVRIMYDNGVNCICQMCCEPTQYPEVVEPVNCGRELKQLHLCLCPECARIFKLFRGKRGDAFNKLFRDAVLTSDVSELKAKYAVQLNDDITINFTQTHLAEVREIFKLID